MHRKHQEQLTHGDRDDKTKKLHLHERSALLFFFLVQEEKLLQTLYIPLNFDIRRYMDKQTGTKMTKDNVLKRLKPKRFLFSVLKFKAMNYLGCFLFRQPHSLFVRKLMLATSLQKTFSKFLS